RHAAKKRYQRVEISAVAAAPTRDILSNSVVDTGTVAQPFFALLRGALALLAPASVATLALLLVVFAALPLAAFTTLVLWATIVTFSTGDLLALGAITALLEPALDSALRERPIAARVCITW